MRPLLHLQYFLHLKQPNCTSQLFRLHNDGEQRGRVAGEKKIRSFFPPAPLLPCSSALYFLIAIAILLASCSAFETTKITPVPQPDATWLYESNAIAAFKEGIAVLAVPLNDVKEVDAFAVIVVNQTDHWVSFYKKECVLLDQGGGHAKPLEKSQLSVYLKKNFEPRMPLSLGSEVFRWKRDIVLKGDTGPIPVEDVDKTSVLPGRRSQF